MGRPFFFDRLPPNPKPALKDALSFWECPRLWQVPAELLEASSLTSPADQMNNEHSKVDFSKPEEVTEQTIYDQLFAMREAGMSEDDLLVHVSEIILQQRQEIERAREEIPHAAAQEQIKQVQDAHERGILKGRDDLMREFRKSVYANLPNGQRTLDWMGYFTTVGGGVVKLYEAIQDIFRQDLLDRVSASAGGAEAREKLKARLGNVNRMGNMVTTFLNVMVEEQLKPLKDWLAGQFPTHVEELNAQKSHMDLLRRAVAISAGKANDKAQDACVEGLRVRAALYARETPVEMPATNGLEELASAIYRAGKHDGEEHFKRDKLRPIDVTWKKVVKTLLTKALRAGAGESLGIYDAVEQITIHATGGDFKVVSDLVGKIVCERDAARIKELAQNRLQRDALAEAIAQVANGYFFAAFSMREETTTDWIGEVRLCAPSTPRPSFDVQDWTFEDVKFQEGASPIVRVRRPTKRLG